MVVSVLDNKKSQVDLMSTFDDQISYLELLVKESQDVNTEERIRNQKCNSISVVLRNLLIDTSRQESLATVLNIKEFLYFKYRVFILSGKNNLSPESLLTGIKIENDKIHFFPILNHPSNTYISFDDWLNEIVIDDKDPTDNLVSRLEIISAIADKIAAHTDREYDKKMHKIGIVKRLNIEYNINGVMKKSENNIFYQALITIAYELIEAYAIYKKVIGFNKEVLIENDIYICEENNLSARRTGYRFNTWPSGTDKTGRSTLNILIMESQNIVTEITIGKLKTHVFSRGKERFVIKYIDFNAHQNSGVVINMKEPFCLVAVEKVKKKYVLLHGSTVTKNSKLDLKHFLFPNKSGIIKNNIESNLLELFLNIGIPPIEIDS